jgi:hypothetical protein
MVHHNAVLGEDKKAAFLLDVAGQEDASFSFDSKRTGGVELESNLARDAVTLRFRVRRPHRSCRRNGGIVIC